MRRSGSLCSASRTIPRTIFWKSRWKDFYYLIKKPQSISVDDGLQGLASMEIVDKDARRQIVKLMEPLMLTPPHKRT